jgi:uncharacterized protein (DUF2141 family)
MKKRLSASIVGLATLGNFLILSSVEATSKNNLTVELNGLKNQTGQVCLSLFSSDQGFPDSKENALQSECVLLGKDSPKITFENLIPGNYAVAVFHDANSDRTLNVNSLGIPTEGFGFSRNPTILAGPPKFGDTFVVVATPQNNIQIKLQYFWNLK